MIESGPERPAYRRLADALRAEIEAGRLVPGAALPSESTLERAHGVGRDTVRDALALLRSWGLVSARQGKGWYVRQPREPEPVRLADRIQVSARMPTAAEQDRWDLDDGVPVLVVERGERIDVYPADRHKLEL